jgi:integrase
VSARSSTAQRGPNPLRERNGSFRIVPNRFPLLLIDLLRKAVQICGDFWDSGETQAAGYDIWTEQELRGHSDVKTTMIYTHVLNREGRGVRSPADGLAPPPPE